MNTDDLDLDLEREDDANLRRLTDRKKSPYPHLLHGAGGRLLGLIGPSVSSTSGLVDDYFELARIAAARTAEQHKVDLALMPVLYLYRHAVELALKYSIVLLRSAAEEAGATTLPGLPEHHDIQSLLGTVKGLFPAAKEHLKQAGKLRFLSGQAVEFIEELHSLDPTGQTFRYVYTRVDDGQVLQVQNDVEIDVTALMAGMLHIETELISFMNNIENCIGLIDEQTADLLSDVNPWQ